MEIQERQEKESVALQREKAVLFPRKWKMTKNSKTVDPKLELDLKYSCQEWVTVEVHCSPNVSNHTIYEASPVDLFGQFNNLQ